MVSESSKRLGKMNLGRRFERNYRGRYAYSLSSIIPILEDGFVHGQLGHQDSSQHIYFKA
jgi:hypothetical protein